MTPADRTPRPRLDHLLVERGLAESRTRARALVAAGVVYSAGARLDKPGRRLAADSSLEVRGRDQPWASRGGVKLAHALALFAIDPAGRVCLDLGASTGGFTDVLLQGGAARVYAVDVGRGQLAPRLGQDARVVVVDGTNARDLGSAHVPEPVELITCDVSFVGLRLALPAALALAAPAAHLIALIKPQFEVGKGRVGKGGVVRDTELHEEVCARLSRWLAEGVGWTVLGLCESPITGPRGNREFLVAARLEALYQSMA